MTDLAAWKHDAMREVRVQLAADPFWARVPADATVHLAVFVEPWLSWLLEGTKTIESRFSVRRTIPYERVTPGDVMLLKASSGPVVGIAEIAKTWFFDFERDARAGMQRKHGAAIGADADFWASVEHARYASLLEIRHVRTLRPIPCPKKDRRGWVVLERRSAL